MIITLSTSRRSIKLSSSETLRGGGGGACGTSCIWPHGWNARLPLSNHGGRRYLPYTTVWMGCACPHTHLSSARGSADPTFGRSSSPLGELDESHVVRRDRRRIGDHAWSGRRATGPPPPCRRGRAAVRSVDSPINSACSTLLWEMPGGQRRAGARGNSHCESVEGDERCDVAPLLTEGPSARACDWRAGGGRADPPAWTDGEGASFPDGRGGWGAYGRCSIAGSPGVNRRPLTRVAEAA